MNAGLVVDLPHLDETGAQSIGLFRTELQFMLALRFPRLSAQELLYRTVLDAAGARPVTFRTLDIGGDKVLPYMKGPEEENPALGWRAIRIGLDKPALLRTQLRAMLRASAGRSLRIMLPMVSSVDEFIAARRSPRAGAQFRRSLRSGASSAELQIGVMVEVPALLWQLDEIASRVDFLSVGSNDLMQYLYAADRDNKRVGARFDALSASFLRALKAIVDAGLRHDKPVTLCGEIGGRPLEAMTLLALGYRGLSMSAASIGPVKAMVLSLDARRGGAGGRRLDRDGRPRRLFARASAGLGRTPRREAVAQPIAHHKYPSNIRYPRASPCRPTTNSISSCVAIRKLAPGCRKAAAASDYATFHANSPSSSPSSRRSAAPTGPRIANAPSSPRSSRIPRPTPKMRARWRVRSWRRPRRNGGHGAQSPALAAAGCRRQGQQPILEVRAGTGGDKAALFAGDLLPHVSQIC